MGLFGMSGDTWKKIGGYALKAAPYVAAPFTGGLSIPIGMAIQGGIGAAQGAAGGGGLKGALIGGGIGAGLGAIPGGGVAGGVVKSLVKPTLGSVAKNAAIQVGTNLGTTALQNLAATKGQGAPTAAGQSAGPGGAPAGTNVYSSALTGEAGDEGPSFGEKYGPAIAQAGGLAAGAFAGKKETESAMERSPEELAALRGAQGSAAGMRGAGESMLGESKPYLRSAGGYYQTLLGGNRAAMSQATAAPRAQLQEQLRGQKSALATSGVRGAARDVLGSRYSRDNAGKVAGLTTGVQPAAAEALANLGTTQAQTATPLLANSGNLYSNLLTGGARNREYARQEGAGTAKAFGKVAADLGTAAFGGAKKKKPGEPTAEPGVGEPPPAPPPSTPLEIGNPGAPGFGGWAPTTTGDYATTAPIDPRQIGGWSEQAYL